MTVERHLSTEPSREHLPRRKYPARRVAAPSGLRAAASANPNPGFSGAEDGRVSARTFVTRTESKLLARLSRVLRASPGDPPVLELKDLALSIGPADAEQTLLSEITLRLPAGHFAAILGPSGCGKSTLLKVIAGIREHTLGTIYWNGRDLATEKDMDPHEIGYVPQFSIAHELLTVEESVETALRLRVADLLPEERHLRTEKVLKAVALDDIGDRRVSLLSGGQKRRLAMAVEMVSSPHLLLCDEVTSGLDPKSEDEMVKLMHALSRADQRIVLSVTHSLQHVSLYDSVIVLYQGALAYHGSPEYLTHYFGIARPEDLYPKLTERKSSDWQRSWQKHRAVYYERSGLPPVAMPSTVAAKGDPVSSIAAPSASEEEEI